MVHTTSAFVAFPGVSSREGVGGLGWRCGCASSSDQPAEPIRTDITLLSLFSSLKSHHQKSEEHG